MEKAVINVNKEFFNELGVCFEDRGPISYLGSNKGIVIKDPKLVNHILIKNHKNYTKGAEFERVKLLTGLGLIVIDGELWRKHRQLVRPAFKNECFQFFNKVITTESDKIVDLFQRASESKERTDISAAMSLFSLDIILRCIFSDDLECLFDDNGMNPFLLFVDNYKRDIDLAKRVWQLRKKIESVISLRRKSSCRKNDILDAYLYARLRGGSKFDDQETINEVMTLIVAGHETSAITLTWMWLLIARDGRVEDKLRAYMNLTGDYNFSENLDKPSPFSIYIEQIMAETLRLYPPVWVFSRKAISDDRYGCLAIPAKTSVYISPYYIQRDSTHWASPDSFIPERFENRSLLADGSGTYLPFSAGSRRCIGSHFTLGEAQILFFKILRMFRVLDSEKFSVQLEPGINLRAANPIFMNVEKI